MKTSTRAAAVLAGSGSALLLAVGPAHAALETERESVDLPAMPWVVCADGTELGVGLHVDFTSQYWSGDDGVVDREKKHMRYSGALTNLATGESRGFTYGARTVHIDWTSGEIVSTGNYRTLTYPGAGALLKYVGREVYSFTDGLVSTSGPMVDETTPEGARALCGLFGLPGGAPAPPPTHD